jgi:hypothetical protein
MGFGAYMGAAEINAIPLTEIQRRLREDDKNYL